MQVVLYSVEAWRPLRDEIKGQGASMKTGLEGKVVLITGATRNHGRASALAFAKEGANLFLTTPSDQEQLEQTARAVSSLGVQVVTGLCDLSSEAQVEAAVNTCIAALGHVDVVVNNVLFPVAAHSFGDVPFAVWKRKMEVELTGSFFLFKTVLPRMIEQKWGRIITLTGLAALQGTDALAASSELGMVGLTRGMAREYGKHNIDGHLCRCAG
jgi:3-oxoacyl-[acyl-carrier protein] reductase